jgi:hypothetical protein
MLHYLKILNAVVSVIIFISMIYINLKRLNNVKNDC